jgi:hypothetical protein
MFVKSMFSSVVWQGNISISAVLLEFSLAHISLA